jgi:hypothetical protein
MSSLIMEVIRTYKMSLLTRTTWHHIPEDDVLKKLTILEKTAASVFRVQYAKQLAASLLLVVSLTLQP